MENDVNLLTKHGLMDYSLYLVIVIKPFKNVEYFIPRPIAQGKTSSQQLTYLDEDKIHFTSVDSTSYKRLFIGEVDTSKIRSTHMIGRREDHIIMVMKERTKNKQILYHICEPYDISSIKIYQEEKKNSDSTNI